MSQIVHKAPSSGTTNLQTLAADRAARALAVNDGLTESVGVETHTFTVTAVEIPDPGVKVLPAVIEQVDVPAKTVTEASVEAAIVKHRDEEAPRPNMAPIIKQRVASVGAGSTRSVPHAPFVPNQPKPVKQSSVGGGQGKRPAPEPIAITRAAAVAEPGKPGAVTAASIAAAIAASRPAAPAPRVMATGKPRR